MNKKQEFIDIARQQVGDDYVWGENGPDEFDCSGLVVWCMQNIEFHFPDAKASTLYKVGCFHIERGDLEPSDLIFKEKFTGIYHVGIYIGDNKVVQAKGKDYGVVISNFSEDKSWNKFGKLKALYDYADIKPQRSILYKVDVETYLSFRKSPNINGEKISSLYNSDKVSYQGEERLAGNNLWFKVSYKGQVGWVASEFLVSTVADEVVEESENESIDEPVKKRMLTEDEIKDIVAMLKKLQQSINDFSDSLFL